MWKDPIVQEVREARAAIFARCGNDVHKLFELVEWVGTLDPPAAPKDEPVACSPTTRSSAGGLPLVFAPYPNTPLIHNPQMTINLMCRQHRQ
jgi:hypothetical protein